MEPYTMTDKIAGLRRAVAYGVENGKKNLIVELDCLVALFSGEVPVGNNVLPVEDVTALLYQVKAERDEFKRRADLWEKLHDSQVSTRKVSVHPTRERMPEPHRIVIVAGGLATWTGSVWLSKTAEDTGRVIEWHVSWWMPLLHDSDTNMDANEQAYGDLAASGGIVDAP